MKRIIAVPAVLVFAFLPVFALQAEKISAPIPSPRVVSSANSEFVLSEPKLRTTLVTVRYPEISGRTYVVVGTCATVSKPVWSSVSPAGIRTEVVPVSVSSECQGKTVTFEISYSGSKIPDSGSKIPDSGISFPVVTENELFSELSDLSDENLFLFARNSADASVTASADSKAVISASGATAKDKLEGLAVSYRASALAYRSQKAYALVDARKDLKYVVPVAGKTIPTEYPFIPGSGRPYRKDTTDGIHHGWDLLAPVGTPVRSVGYGEVVRVVSGFAWRDFDRLVKGSALSNDQKALNLDVFRGNQVWIKTADGNVTFYSHLSVIAPDVAPGKMVVAGEILGNVGITGVPDKNYDMPHLHFEIQKNPHDGSDSKEPISVMRWDWLSKGLGKAGVDELAEKDFLK